MLPMEFAAALLTAGVAFSYGRIGVGAVGLLAVVLFIFQYLIRTFVDVTNAAKSSGAAPGSSPRSRWAC